jgi:hypothetical protein
VAVSLFTAAALSLCAGAMLTPSYLFATLSQRQAAAEGARLSGSQAGEQAGDIALLGKTNEEVKSLARLLSLRNPSSSIESVLQAASADISLTHIDYLSSGGTLSISGRAISRDALLLFARAVQKLPEVESSNLPVGDLAKNTDVSFNITAVLTRK